MAVGASTAAESDPVGPCGPIRTCIGCRQRATAAVLLRVVVAPDAAGTSAAEEGAPVSVVPDPRHRRPGRGAWLHPDLKCVELAQRRRAFGRALRVAGRVDPAAVHEYVAQAATTSSGNPQEMKS